MHVIAAGCAVACGTLFVLHSGCNEQVEVYKCLVSLDQTDTRAAQLQIASPRILVVEGRDDIFDTK